MPSGKRETEKKGNTPVNTGPSPNSDGRANNLVEEADEPARGSGPLQYNLMVTMNANTIDTIEMLTKIESCLSDAFMGYNEANSAKQKKKKKKKRKKSIAY
ncbi:hypothetical protein T12_10102 [Trichinella patagoniensis]|uniref:Uncharacterized protein n=1 Tax=Trichinella patagoniensis TaxID=990121 RepID=A0A0V0ZL18_9BILA|nr:hypothetical protein T12_10102 [Trichinella patagoniensis]